MAGNSYLYRYKEGNKLIYREDTIKKKRWVVSRCMANNGNKERVSNEGEALKYESAIS